MIVRRLASLTLGVLMSIAAGGATAASHEIFHADSLAGPMRGLKSAFETKQAGITVNLTSATSKQLAERILAGERCDVFASSAPSVIENDLMTPASHAPVAAWLAVFSANEMVVVTRSGNPRRIARMADLAALDLRLARVTGDKDLATQRSIDFIGRALKLEGVDPGLAQKILQKAPADPTRPVPVPAVIDAVKSGAADAGVVYLSAAVAAQDGVAVIRFPAEVNMSEVIRNAATVPATAQNAAMAEAFVKFLLSAEGREILERTGQPPIVPPALIGAVPDAVR